MGVDHPFGQTSKSSGKNPCRRGRNHRIFIVGRVSYAIKIVAETMIMAGIFYFIVSAKASVGAGFIPARNGRA
jgi:hypothetical protein